MKFRFSLHSYSYIYTFNLHLNRISYLSDNDIYFRSFIPWDIIILFLSQQYYIIYTWCVALSLLLVLNTYIRSNNRGNIHREICIISYKFYMKGTLLMIACLDFLDSYSFIKTSVKINWSFIQFKVKTNRSPTQHFSASTFMVPYLHQFYAALLLEIFGTNLHYVWCQFSIIIFYDGSI
jgi:hypothetical protein